MALIDAMQSASVRLQGLKPSAFFSSTDTFEMEIVDLVNEVAKDIMASNDWQAAVHVAEFVGDGTNLEFDKPADYDRMLVHSDIQDPQNWIFGFQHVPDINSYLWRKSRGFGPWPGIWIMFDDKFQFWPAPAAGQSARFPYISKNYAINASDGTRKAAFSRDDDTFILPERLLTLGLVWRWRENKKLDFTGDQEAFMKAISEYSSKDAGSNIIRRSSAGIRGNFYPGWPWPLGS